MSLQRYSVQAAPEPDFNWLAQKTGCALTSDFNAIEALDEAGHIRGMVGYCAWTKNSVQMHMATESPSVWRTLLRPALEYAFVEVGVGICLGVIPDGNARSLRFAKAVGFREVHRVKDGWAKGEDLVVLELRREDCPLFLSDERRAA